MGGRWNLFGSHMHKVLWVVLMLHLQSDECLSLNLEGMALLKFRLRVEVDPHGALENWDPTNSNPCNWTGVCCNDGKVEILNLKELSLGGMLAPELGELSHLRALVLYTNNFSGVIPKEIGKLTMLELLDLRGNNLSGTIPKEIGNLLSLRCLLVSDNKFQGGTRSWIKKLNMLSEIKFDQNLSFDLVTGISCINRKVRDCIWQGGLQQLKKANSSKIPFKDKLLQFLEMFSSFKLKRGFLSGHGERHGRNLPSSAEPYIMASVQQTENFLLRRLLQENNNLPAAPASGAPTIAAVVVPSTGSGSFPAVPNGGKKSFPKGTMPADLLPSSLPMPQIRPGPSKPTDSLRNEPTLSERLRKWAYILVLPGIALLITIAVSMLLMRHRRGVAVIGPWRTGLSGDLQKAFITGSQKLNRQELEAACEDFSNIIIGFPEYKVFKGTLSSGVEIAVASTVIKSVKDWSKRSEMYFRRKVDTLSRINHKNFVNFLGYCEEDEPFTRMMVLEYAPNGTLCQHLHDKDFEHLDWSARVRIIMGTAYCLQYMHHELDPPMLLPDLQSTSVLMTNDYAAKVLDCSVWKEVLKRKVSGDYEMDPSESTFVDPRSNVYSFGMLLLEIISGKLPYSEEQGSLLNLVMDYLNGKGDIKNLVDPTLKSFKDNELDIICEAILECTHHDPKKRPTMKSVIAKLRDVISISPEAASPRLSPLWWAELEILSVEAS